MSGLSNCYIINYNEHLALFIISYTMRGCLIIVELCYMLCDFALTCFWKINFMSGLSQKQTSEESFWNLCSAFCEWLISEKPSKECLCNGGLPFLVLSL